MHHVLHMHAQERGRSVVQQYAKRFLKPSPSRTPDLRRAVVRDPCEQAMGRCSLGVCPRGMATMGLWHGTLHWVADACRTSGVAFPFVLKRLSNTAARLRDICTHARFEPCEAIVSQRWGDDCPRGMATMGLWHGTLRGVADACRTSGVAFPFALNTAARLRETSARMPDSRPL